MLKNKIQNYKKGFSLVELLVVVAILSILTTMIIPNYRAYSKQSKRNAVKPSLAYIYNLLKLNYIDKGTFKNTKLTNISPPEGYCITTSIKGTSSEQPSPIGNCSSRQLSGQKPLSGFVIIAHGKDKSLNIGMNHKEEFKEDKTHQQIFSALTVGTRSCTGYNKGTDCRQAGCVWDIVNNTCSTTTISN